MTNSHSQVAPNATNPTTSSYLLPSDVENPFDYLDTIIYYVETINDIALPVCDEDDIPKTHVHTLFTVVEQKLKALR